MGTGDPGGVSSKSEPPNKTTEEQGSEWWRRNAGQSGWELVVEGKVGIFIIRQYAEFHSLAPRMVGP